jgi:hypothetical protein
MRSSVPSPQRKSGRTTFHRQLTERLFGPNVVNPLLSAGTFVWVHEYLPDSLESVTSTLLPLACSTLSEYRFGTPM